ncbi:MAG: hypothetical protein AAF696_01315 [Bacteroidota bacterium]
MNKLLLSLLLLLFMSCMAFSAEYQYSLTWLNPNTHTYVVEARAQSETSTHTTFMLPAWRPGRYIMQNYAGAISHFEAWDASGNELKWQKVNKDSWKVMHKKAGEIRIRYRYFANNRDAGSSYYGLGEAYFNPVNLFMHVRGRYNDPVRLEVPKLSEDWKIATALKQNGSRKSYRAKSYHEFVDSPTVFAEEMKTLNFSDGGCEFNLHFQGEFSGGSETEKAILEGVKKIVQEQSVLFGGYPFEEYHFIYRLLPYRMRHAVEHSNSASFALPSTVTQNPRVANTGILGITSHEFFHVWNVKRIRPAALWPYDYSQQQYTSLHWFTEGVTEYYTQLTLVRAGIIDEEEFYKRLSNTIQSLEGDYASKVVSPSLASFDSWLARSPYAHPDHQISYYTLGSRLGLLIDMEMRKRSKGSISFDQVFQLLYKNTYQKNKGVSEEGVQKALESLTGDSWENFFQDYVDGTTQIDYEQFLGPMGLEMKTSVKEASGKRALGILAAERISQGHLISRVIPGSDIYEAGVGADDLLLEIGGKKAGEIDLDEWANELKVGDKVYMSVLLGLKDLKEVEFTYTGESRSKRYQIASKKKPKVKELVMRRAWLESRVK